MSAAIQRPHPAQGDWVKFYVGRLPESESLWMRDHLAACDFCWDRFLSLGTEALRLTPPPVAEHPTRTCPDDETLAAAAEGSLEGSALARLDRHIEGCDRCEASLRDLRVEVGPGAGSDVEEVETVARSLTGRLLAALRRTGVSVLAFFRIEDSATLRTLSYLRSRNNRLERVLQLWRGYGEALSPFLAFRDESTPREHLRHHALIAREMGPLYAANPGDYYLSLALGDMSSFLSRISSPDLMRELTLRERYSLYDQWHEIYLALTRLQGMRTLGAPIRPWGAGTYHEPWVRRTGTDR